MISNYLRVAVRILLRFKVYSVINVAGLAIDLACSILILAAINFTSLTTAKSSIRAREVGIRKVMGSSRNRIIYQLLDESVFLSMLALIIALAAVELTKWILIANILACPVGWCLMKNWLQNFAYKTNINWWIFIFSGAISLFIALLTVSRHAIKLGFANPANSLRYE